MLTMDVIKYSQEDGLTYTSSFGDYSEKKGFQLNEKGREYLRDYPDKFLKMLFTDNTVWQVKPDPPKKMTIQEIRDALGYDFEIVDYDEKKEQKENKEYKTLGELINEVLGFGDDDGSKSKN